MCRLLPNHPQTEKSISFHDPVMHFRIRLLLDRRQIIVHIRRLIFPRHHLAMQAVWRYVITQQAVRSDPG